MQPFETAERRMFFTYLRRELRQRRRQSLLVALGLGLAIALVITVTSVTAGVGDAQDEVLESVYGVGTDITVSTPPQRPDAAAGGGGTAGGGPRTFQFDQEGTEAAGGGRSFDQDQLRTSGATMDAAAVESVAGIDGVSAVAGTLSMTSTSFTGEIPAFGSGQMPARGSADDGSATGPGSGGSFSVTSVDIEGVDLTAEAVGPLSSTALDEGRGLTESDAGAQVALVDATYAAENDVAVDGTVTLGGTDFTVVGIVSSASASATTAADVFVPLDTLQTLAEQSGQLSTLYVQAASADVIDEVQTAIETTLPDATVSTADDLAGEVSGSLSSASELARTLGTWLAALVLLAAFVLAVLFTLSGVSRRVREFGTLKALGWRSRRVVGQVMGESLAQGLLGGAVGLALGLGAVLVINLVAPELSATVASSGAGAGAGAGGRPGGFGGPGGEAADAASAVAVTLAAPVTVTTVLLAVAIAVLGGLLAGAVGGWRASRMRPAEALRSVA
ncbi:ABC transporter permease [Blastococcus sp. SYSU DS1024]